MSWVWTIFATKVKSHTTSDDLLLNIVQADWQAWNDCAEKAAGQGRQLHPLTPYLVKLAERSKVYTAFVVSFAHHVAFVAEQVDHRYGELVKHAVDAGQDDANLFGRKTFHIPRPEQLPLYINDPARCAPITFSG